MIFFKVLVQISCVTFGFVHTEDPLLSDKVENFLSHAMQREDFMIRYSIIQGADEVPISESFDARENWPDCVIIQWIRNQWDCHCSCFVFAVVSMIADRICIANEGIVGINQTELSAYEAMTCCSECMNRMASEQHPKYQECLEIDFFTSPIEQLIVFGLASGGDYNTPREKGCSPITSRHIKQTYKCSHYYCRNGHQVVKKETPFPQASVKRLLIKNIEDTNKIQREIKENGPVAAFLFVDDEFRNYKQGVYKGVSKVNLSDVAAVKILGWGVENKEPYWLAANSMGTDWGDKGFLKIVRDARVVRFFAAVDIPHEKKNKDENSNENNSFHAQALEKHYIVLIVITFVMLFLLS